MMLLIGLSLSRSSFRLLSAAQQVLPRRKLQRPFSSKSKMSDVAEEKTTERTSSPTRELVYHQKTRGIDVLRDPKINKGMAFSLRERQVMGIHGLLPPLITDQNDQVARIMASFHRWDNDLDRYIFLMGLQDRNEKLFYRTLMQHVDIMMPVVYTPTVGLACQKYGLVFRKPRGLYITIHDKGHIYEMLCNWPEHDVRAIVVTDGQRILGLGDLGAYGMGIPVGKLSLYTALAGIKPHFCLPIVLDVGTNNKNLLEDPLYIGIRQPRVEGAAYDDFIDEFMEASIKRYGQDTLVQFEDFGNHNAFRFLEKYRDRYCTFNDDIQGTASVALAGVLASLRITETKLSQNTFVFFGAGEASIGIAKLVVMAMEDEGTSTADAMSKIWLVDSKGLIVKDRPSGGLNPEKSRFAKPHQNIESLVEVVKTLKPNVLIGAAAQGGAFTDEIIQLMSSYNKRPIIFALSNPTSKAECTAQQVYSQSDGRAVFASGSPFDPVDYKGKTYHTGQGNNSYIFPGVALGVILCGVRHIQEDIFLRSAQALANQVTKADLEEGRVYPPLSKIQDVSVKIAVNIAGFVYKTGMAAHYPEPKDKEKFIRSQLYNTDYEQFVPELYDWPGQKSSL